MDNPIVIITFNLLKCKKFLILNEGSPNWMDMRIALFEQYTLPSFENQCRDKRAGGAFWI